MAASQNNPRSTQMVKEALSCSEAVPSREEGSQSPEPRQLASHTLLGRLAGLHRARGWRLLFHSLHKGGKTLLSATLWLSNIRNCTTWKNNKEEE